MLTYLLIFLFFPFPSLTHTILWTMCCRIYNVGNDVIDIQEKVRQTDEFITLSYDDCSYSPLLNRDVEENDGGLPPMTTLENTLVNFENDVIIHGNYVSDFRRELYKYDTTSTKKVPLKSVCVQYNRHCSRSSVYRGTLPGGLQCNGVYSIHIELGLEV